VFEKNDVVRVLFKMSFVVGGEAWFPEIVPVEFVRVAKLENQPAARSNPDNYLAMPEDFQPLETGFPVMLSDGIPC